MLKNRLPWIVSVIALVFALGGGAFAASNSEDSGATTKANLKKGIPGPRGPRGKPGKTGPAGPQGPAGANGAKGDTGATGATGAEGKPGKEGKEGPKGPEGPKGKEGKEGPEGSPWTAGGVLPSGETETGAWAIGNVSEGAKPEGFGSSLLTPISFFIPLAAPLDASHVHFIGPGGKEIDPNTELEKTEPPVNCLGTVTAPSAVAGHLCIYSAILFNVTSNNNRIHSASDGLEGASIAGATLGLRIIEPGAEAFGTWAVTAP
jgi:hypothetical protein